MHTDENKKFDKRNIERNVKDKIITQKDYEIYLSKLTDVKDNVFNPDEISEDSNELESKKSGDIQSKKGLKKKAKAKGK